MSNVDMAGGIYASVGGSSLAVTAGYDGLTISIGGQASAVYTVSGSTDIKYHPDTGFTITGSAMEGVGTPSGMPGMTFSWLIDPSGINVQGKGVRGQVFH